MHTRAHTRTHTPTSLCSIITQGLATEFLFNINQMHSWITSCATLSIPEMTIHTDSHDVWLIICKCQLLIVTTSQCIDTDTRPVITHSNANKPIQNHSYTHWKTKPNGTNSEVFKHTIKINASLLVAPVTIFFDVWEMYILCNSKVIGYSIKSTRSKF